MAAPRSMPLRITPDNGPWPLRRLGAAREAEHQALAAAAPYALMARAGHSVARLALALAPAAQRITVFAGPGHNGGDGLVAARHLHAAGLKVQVWYLEPAGAAPADVAWALRQAREAGVAIAPLAAAGGTIVTPAAAGVGHSLPDLAIDALLGIGARQAPRAPLAQAIALLRRWREADLPVLAVDLPSGLDADTGQPLGEAVVRASATLALLSLTPGCFTGQGRDLAGEVWFDDLGALPPPADPGPPCTLAGPATRRLAAHTAHKGSQGDVVVVGGAPGLVGAAWLAARAALAAGAGRVYLAALGEAPTLDPARPELMRLTAPWAAGAAPLADATVVCGCGGGDPARSLLPAVLGRAARLVLDADALNAIAADASLPPLLRARAARGQPTVLTPHPLEAARLLGCTTAQVQADRLAAARALAAQTGAVVVLKGSGTVSAAPDGTCRVNPSGNAALATAGSGDVLAGWMGGAWARTAQPQATAVEWAPEATLRVAADAVWQHGRAADHHAAGGHAGPLLAADLVEALAALPASPPPAAARG